MARQLLNHYVSISGDWVPGQSETFDSADTVNIGNMHVRLYETSVGGMVLLSPQGGTLTSYGESEVYLTINFASGPAQYLSAPLTTPFDLSNVASIELHTLFWIGNSACTKVSYRALVDAHCIYEVLVPGPSGDHDS